MCKKYKLGNKLLNLDKFGEAFNVQIEKDRLTLPSRMGAACSIFFIIILLIFMGYKVHIMQSKGDIDIISAVQENYFESTFEFGGD